MPVGLSMPGVRSVRSFSARSMRCSISRIDDRYSSSLRRSEAPRSADSCGRPLAHEIEDAAAVLHAARAHVGREARVDVAEEAFEHEAGVRFRRHRRRRPAPRQAVRVRARIAGVAVADGARVVAPELDRSEARLFREAHGRDLIDRDAVLDVGARRLLGVHARQIRGSRARVIARPVAEGVAVALREAREHDRLLAVLLERLQHARVLERPPGRFRRPVDHRDAVRHVREAEPEGRLAHGRRGERRRHRVEHRQGDDGAHPLQERPAVDVLARDDHGCCAPAVVSAAASRAGRRDVKGRLLTISRTRPENL